MPKGPSCVTHSTLRETTCQLQKRGDGVTLVLRHCTRSVSLSDITFTLSGLRSAPGTRFAGEKVPRKTHVTTLSGLDRDPSVPFHPARRRRAGHTVVEPKGIGRIARESDGVRPRLVRAYRTFFAIGSQIDRRSYGWVEASQEFVRLRSKRTGDRFGAEVMLTVSVIRTSAAKKCTFQIDEVSGTEEEPASAMPPSTAVVAGQARQRADGRTERPMR